MIKKINILFEMAGKNIEANESNETKTLSDYLPSVSNEAETQKAKEEDKKSEVNLNDVIKQFGKVINSEEVNKLEEQISSLTDQEMNELKEWTKKNISPKIESFKEEVNKALHSKGFKTKVDSMKEAYKEFKQKAEQMIKDLANEIKELKENKEAPRSEIVKKQTQSALLKVAFKA